MINYYSKVALLVICFVLLSTLSVFAGSMDDLLINSVRNNDINMVKTALANGADINYNSNQTTPLVTAINSENLEMVKYLVDNGADVNMKYYWRAYNQHKMTPILYAIEKRNFKVVKYLIEKGADINATYEGNGNTALMFATVVADMPIFQLLLQQKADINQGDNNSFTPLMMVAARSSYPYIKDENRIYMAKLLLKAGADPTKRTVDGKIALQYAIKTNFSEMVNLLLPLSPKD